MQILIQWKYRRILAVAVPSLIVGGGLILFSVNGWLDWFEDPRFFTLSIAAGGAAFSLWISLFVAIKEIQFLHRPKNRGRRLIIWIWTMVFALVGLAISLDLPKFFTTPFDWLVGTIGVIVLIIFSFLALTYVPEDYG